MNGQVTHWLASTVITLIVFIFSLNVHEFAHAITATLCGDDTPRRQGRLTLNPLAHIDVIGLLCILLFSFGWARPVEFNPNNFKHSKTFSLLTAIAGPLANFVLAIICMVMLSLINRFPLPLGIYKTFIQIFQAGAAVNVVLGVFNFIPIPPLDGGHLLMVIFDEKAPKISLWLRQNSFLIMIILLLFMSLMGSSLLGVVYSSVYAFLANLVFY